MALLTSQVVLKLFFLSVVTRLLSWYYSTVYSRRFLHNLVVIPDFSWEEVSITFTHFLAILDPLRFKKEFFLRPLVSLGKGDFLPQIMYSSIMWMAKMELWLLECIRLIFLLNWRSIIKYIVMIFFNFLIVIYWTSSSLYYPGGYWWLRDILAIPTSFCHLQH